MARDALTTPGQLLRQRRFGPLFWTQFFGAFNDNFLKNALVILVEYKSLTVLGMSPPQIVALAGGIFILPFFLFSALAGQIADKYEKGKIIRWIKLVEIFIMIFAASGFVFHQPGFLLVVLFAMGLHSTFFGPIKYSILPQHLQFAELLTGNAVVEAGTFVAILLGTITGGVMIALPDGEKMVSLGLMGIALTGYLTSRWIPKAAAAFPSLKTDFGLIKPTRHIFSFTKNPPSVFWSTVAISWFWFVGAVMLSIFPSLCKEVLHGPPSLVTTYLALFSIGIAAGSLLTGRLSKGKVNLRFVTIGFFGLSLFSVALWFFSVYAVNLTWIGFLLFSFSIFGGFFIVPLYTLLQERSDSQNRSRVIAANNILNAAFMVLASLLLLLLLHFHFTVPQVMLILAALNIIALYLLCLKMPELSEATRQFFRLR
jgi:MFS family permease